MQIKKYNNIGRSEARRNVLEKASKADSEESEKHYLVQ